MFHAVLGCFPLRRLRGGGPTTGVFALALMYSFVDNTDPASYRDMEFLVDTCVHECRPSKVHPAAEWVSYADGAARLRWRVPTLLNQGRPVRFRAIFHAKQLPNSGIWVSALTNKRNIAIECFWHKRC